MKIIGHLDMDAFFAAVEERDKPRLKGKPIVVGADPKDGKGRGVVATANYKAREYGIRSALPISKAWQFSKEAEKQGKPAAVFISGNHEQYSNVSEHIMEILAEHSPTIQKVGIDEAYFDLSHTGSYKNAERLAKKIQSDIEKKERLTASIGIGPNKLIAKIASDYKKPNGLTIVAPKNIEAFIEPLPIRKIPGIGPKAEIILAQLKIQTVKDLRKLSETELHDLFGKWGTSLYKKARGIGDTDLVTRTERKSIGEETTFSKDSLDAAHITEALKNVCADVHRRFMRSGFESFRTIAIKVRFSDFVTKSRAKTFSEPLKDKAVLEFEALRLLLPFFEDKENPRRQPLRLIGVRIEKLSR